MSVPSFIFSLALFFVKLPFGSPSRFLVSSRNLTRLLALLVRGEGRLRDQPKEKEATCYLAIREKCKVMHPLKLEETSLEGKLNMTNRYVWCNYFSFFPLLQETKKWQF